MLITVKKSMVNVLKKNTRSICPVCWKEIAAEVVEENNRVFLVKECDEHGKYKFIIENEPWLYKRLMNYETFQKSPFTNLSVSITNSCNLDCSICYSPNRTGNAFSFQDIKRIISDFTGKFVSLSGGEPTLREDLPQILRYVKETGKQSVLLTNGLKLVDINYVNKLKDAGLNWVHFSFNGFRDSVYEEINGKKLLRIKLKALENLKKLRIQTTLSVMLVRGVNEKELKAIYHYCLKNNSFIKQLRIRSAVQVGKHIEEYFYLSEIVKLLSAIIGFDERSLVNHSLKESMSYSACGAQKYHMPCHLEINLFRLIIDELGITKIGSSVFKKGYGVFTLFLKLGIKNLMKIGIRKILKRAPLFNFNILIRVWPDKYRIDLDEIQRCPRGYAVDKDNKMLPFCYSIILNEKKDIL